MPEPHWRQRGHRPPWWPADEPWPPTDDARTAEWRHCRRGFVWRAGCALLFVVALVITLIVLFSWLIETAVGGEPLMLAIVVAVFLVVVAGRAFQRVAAPVGDLIEASAKVEGGDFSTRVSERGPREVRALARAFNAMSARLEETEQQRRSALADVSHELRTPLAVIQGNIEAIRDGVYPADADHLEPILDEIFLMERLIDDLRTLTLAEAGELVLHREPTDLAGLIRDVVAGHQAQADRAGVTLACHAPDGVAPLDLDPVRIREVLANLLSNALRHTPPGGSVDVTLEQTDTDQVVTVRDTGPGMTPDQLDRVFDRFYRAPDSPGSGLGLPIARDLVTAHGGTMTAESQPGRGTTITVTFPKSL